MSKFCGNCGAQLDDNAIICGYCGAKINPIQPINAGSVNIPGVSKISDPIKEEKNKKLVKIIIAAIAIIIVAVIAINIIAPFVGYKGAVKKSINALENEDSSAMADIMSDMWNIECDYSESDVESEADDIISSMMNELDDNVGYNIKISYSIEDTDKLSSKKFDSFMDNRLSDEYADEYSDINVKEIMVVDLKLTVKGSKGKEEYTCNGCYYAKENNKWKLIDFGDLNRS